MNGSTVSQPRAIELNSKTHAHTYTHWHPLHTPLVQSFHCLGVTMETPLPPSLLPTHTTGTITPTTVLSSVILWAVRKRYWSMTERNGLSGWLVEKTFKGLGQVCHASSYPSTPGQGVCVCEVWYRCRINIEFVQKCFPAQSTGAACFCARSPACRKKENCQWLAAVYQQPRCKYHM